jgi:SAM-dependent methyltransferase
MDDRSGLPVLLSTRDRADAFFRDYVENYDTIAEDDLAESIQPERYIEIQSRKFVSYMPRVAGRIVCDVGAGKGYLARHLLEAGARRVFAADIAVPYLQRLLGDARLVPFVANAENLPFRDAFDLLAATDVLEHVLHVPRFLAAAKRAIRPGGHLCIRVPHRENLMCYAPALGCKYRFVHLRSFDEELLRSTVTCAGFEVERIDRDGFWRNQPQPWWTTGRVRPRLLRLALAALERGLADPLDLNRRPNRLVEAFLVPTTITVVARKLAA